MSNFLVLMSDEHNPFYASPYGHQTVLTPRMQTLADEGVVFDAAYCPSPLCLPSRSAFMAGRRVHQLQTYSNCNINLDPSPLSYGAALSRQGVQAVYIGKTDVYAPGHSLGFSRMILPEDRRPPGDINHRRNPMTIRKGAAARAEKYGPRQDAGSGDIRCVQQAIQYLRDAAAIRSPWVLIVNITSPHFPHYASPEFWRMYPEQDLPKLGTECEPARHPYAEAIRRHFETERFTNEQVRGQIHGYLSCISFVDAQLGKLLDALEDAKLADNTNVVYTSDHGEMLGKFGMWWKCSLYEDAVRIPLIARGPDFGSGLSVKTPVDLHDLRASLFTATNTQQPEGWLGTPLQHIPEDDADRVVFSEYHGHGAPGSSYMIRRGKWKYLNYSGAPCQLFDLDSDSNELRNLATSEQGTVAELDGVLQRICSPSRENDRAEQFINQQLRAVGLLREPVGRGIA